MNTDKLNKLKQLGEMLTTDIEGLQFDTDNIFAGYFYFNNANRYSINAIVEFANKIDVKYLI